MSLTAAELRAVYVVDEAPLDRSLAGLPGKVGKVKPDPVKIDGDDRGLQGAVVSAEKGAGRLTAAYGRAATMVAGFFAFDAVARFVGSTITAASDLNQTVSTSSVIFAENADEIDRWARGAWRSVGLSRRAATEAAVGFGDMFQQLGFARSAAADMSTETVQLAADLGAFRNLKTSDVVERITAAFRGEYDSLQLLIPNINAARVETEALATTGKKNAAELTAQEKAAATLAIVQRDGAKAMGAFAREADELGGSQQQLTARWEDAKVKLGELLQGPATGIVNFLNDTGIPAFEFLVSTVSTLVGAFADLPGPIQAGVIGLGAMAAFGGPLTSMFDGMRGVLGGARDTVSSFSEALGYARANGDGLATVLRSASSYAGGKVVSGFKAMARAIGPELGVALAVTAVGFLIDGIFNLGEASDEAKAAAEGLARSLTLVDEAADRKSVRRAMEDTEGLVEQLEAAGISAETAIDGLLGQADAQERVTEALREYMATRNTPQQGGDAEDVRQAILAYEELATGYGNAASNARYFAGATDEVAGATEKEATQHDAAADAAERQDEALQNLKSTFDEITGKAISVAEAQIDVNDGLRAFTDALEDNGTSLEANTAKGDANRSAVLEQIKAIQDLSTATFDQSGSVDQARGAYEREMGALRQRLVELGYNEQAVDEMIATYGRIPEEKWTRVYADTQQAVTALSTVTSLLSNVKDKTITVTTRTQMSDGSTQVRRNQASLQATGGVVSAFAGGGFQPMAGGLAKIVGPNTWRVIGDRVVDDEAYIPINRSARSREILALTAQRMGYGITARVPVGVTAPPAGGGVSPAAGSSGGIGELVHIDNYHEAPGSSPYATAQALAIEARTRGWS